MRRAGYLGLLFMVVGLSWPSRVAATSWHVGLQAGHWRANELPDELSRLRSSTGTAAAGYREYQVNLDIAQRTATLLRAGGMTVDILPSTVPPSYQADAFVALHADGNSDTRLSGYKLATFWQPSVASTALSDALQATYAAATGLAWDGNHISAGMRGYYAFASGRFDHAVAATTPAVILEMGYLTNPRDRQLMTQQADQVARGVANGIIRFLLSKPAAGWPPPPALPEYRATVTASIAYLRAGPGTSYPVVRVLRRDRQLLISEVHGQWLKVASFRSSGERWISRSVVNLKRIHDDPIENP
jgi:hypothetical protein